MTTPLRYIGAMTRAFKITRFAPSPTGYLHLGHVAAAACAFGLGRHLGADVLLRIEDHDRSRARPEYEQAIFMDLGWLGFVPRNAEFRFGVPSRFRQSDNDTAYAHALEVLKASHQVYACDCSRKQIADEGDFGGELRYLGRCRDRDLPLDAPGAGLRVALPDEVMTFDDLILGQNTQAPARQCGDLLLRDRLGQWTYQFAVTVDDLDQGVDLVIRGQDLTESTGRQIWLGRALGRTRDARFAHHPLVRDPDGKKLGKRFFSEAVAKRRAAGERPEDVLGEALAALGVIPTARAVAPDELAPLFAALPLAPGAHDV